MEEPGAPALAERGHAGAQAADAAISGAPGTAVSSVPGSSAVSGAIFGSSPISGVPIWLGHLAAVSWRVLVVLALVGFVVYVAGVLLVATASVVAVGFIAATASPLKRRLSTRGWSRSRVAVVTWLCSWAVIAVVALLVALALVPVAVDAVRAIAAGVQAFRDNLTNDGLAPEASVALQQAAAAIQDWLVSQVKNVASTVSLVASVVIISFFLSFFVILDADHGWVWISQFVPVWSRDEMEQSSHDAVDRVGGYVREAGVTSAIRTVIVFVALSIVGVPYAAALAAMVFIGGFVPYLGGLVTTSAIFFVALVSNGAAAATALVVLIVVVDLALGRYGDRVVANRSARFHPAVVLAVLLVGSALAGLAGLFVAVPVAAFLVALSGPAIAAIGGNHGAEPVPDSFIPAWLDRLAQWSWRALLGLLLAGVVIFIAGLLPLFVGALVLAAVLAATFAPLVRALRKRGMTPTVAALVATLGTAVVAGVILGLTLVSLVAQVGAIGDSATGGSDTANQATDGLIAWLTQIVQTSTAAILAAVAAGAAAITVIVIVVVFSGILTFFLLRDAGAGWSVVTSRMADWRRKELDAAGNRAVGALGGYMLGTGVLSAFGAVTQWFIMFVLGLPLALPLAILSFFGGFIPYFGSFITTALAFLVTVKYGSTQDIVIMGIFTIVINLVQGSILGPIIYGRAVSIHPGVVLLAVPVGSALAGIVGMFLIIPVLGIIATTWRAVLFVIGDGTRDSTIGNLEPSQVPSQVPSAGTPDP